MTQNLNWESARVFVSGASGIVGSWLCKELLARGARITALIVQNEPDSELFRSGDIDRLDVVEGILENFENTSKAIRSSGAQCVFHLGAITIVNQALESPLETFETNIRGTYNLLEACRQNSDRVNRIVIASSDKAYGYHPTLPYTEEMRLNGRYPYEVSKTCADLIGQSFYTTYGLPIGIARCGNVFGGGDLNWSRIVPSTIRSLLAGERPVVRSDGTYIRDYIYVKDAADAYISLAAALNQPGIKGEAFNFGNESPVTVNELVSEIQELVGLQLVQPHILSATEGEIHSQYLSCHKARDLLSWQPTYDRNTALTETIEWYREFLAIAD